MIYMNFFFQLFAVMLSMCGLATLVGGIIVYIYDLTVGKDPELLSDLTLGSVVFLSLAGIVYAMWFLFTLI